MFRHFPVILQIAVLFVSVSITQGGVYLLNDVPAENQVEDINKRDTPEATDTDTDINSQSSSEPVRDRFDDEHYVDSNNNLDEEELTELMKAILAEIFKEPKSTITSTNCKKRFGHMYGVGCVRRDKTSSVRSDSEESRFPSKIYELLLAVQAIYKKKRKQRQVPFADLTRQLLADTDEEYPKRIRDYESNLLDNIDLRDKTSRFKRKHKKAPIALDYADFNELRRSDARKEFAKKQEKMVITLTKSEKRPNKAPIVLVHKPKKSRIALDYADFNEVRRSDVREKFTKKLEKTSTAIHKSDEKPNKPFMALDRPSNKSPISLDYGDFNDVRSSDTKKKFAKKQEETVIAINKSDKEPNKASIALDYADFNDFNRLDTRKKFTKKQEKIIIDYINSYKPKKRFGVVDNEGIKIPRKPKRTKRFRVVERSENSDSLESVQRKLKQLKVDNVHSQETKMSVKPINARRQRLPHFLPKRYQWKHSDIRSLPYYWFSGPVDRNSIEMTG